MNHWQNKIVVVTGGSEGLGREIALVFARHSANVIVLGRDSTKLQSLTDYAASLPSTLEISGVVADVTNDSSVESAVEQIVSQHSRIDCWINNVGKSTRAAVIDCEIETYQQLMELNFYSAVRCSKMVLPWLEKTSGHLVNIGSLASKTGWPNMAPYSASKHALAAFHHQLRLEGPRNVHYLHVCPGPIQRLDSATRYAAAAAKLGNSATQPGGGVKMKGLEPQKLAEKIECAVRRRKTELVMPGYTRLLFALAQLFPRWTDWVLLKGKKKD